MLKTVLNIAHASNLFGTDTNVVGVRGDQKLRLPSFHDKIQSFPCGNWRYRMKIRGLDTEH